MVEFSPFLFVLVSGAMLEAVASLYDGEDVSDISHSASRATVTRNERENTTNRNPVLQACSELVGWVRTTAGCPTKLAPIRRS